ncbi:hypothetical protein LTR10_023438 [Elasticomyces elasticus]|uniref:Xylanolytic transcriptional activator regulatory domain-containing protein n=1 Tax=Exophiala sideris TaxID=1016849 RepID=A0ABR0J5P6_9EURO|nr:hypothetical protein LTR10_023438 [Elasticomyces elasticus]KAK5028278.1 hypothetical protein LTS07_006369 [Exophiala sideris]KAK5036079.1 hypothetical protein LTR13_005649 [Exophiala sideris]KAK5057116.1 hypothetical protein LTR69_007754 [Exophiala sideris]KAK5181523.1 hypothetical protein LTR44_006318 [Eurotiomycetes sp. CCFEE 6388]
MAAVPCFSRSRKKRQVTRQTSLRPSTAHSSIGNVSDTIELATAQDSESIQLTSPDRAQEQLPLAPSNIRPKVPSTAIYGASGVPQLPVNDVAPGLQWDQFPSQAGVAHQAPQSSPSTTTTEDATFIGRDHYTWEEEQIDETSARAFHASTSHDVSDVASQTLHLWKTFDVPTKSARASLVDSYRRRCYPWTPVLERHDDVQITTQIESSMFLSQCLFLAASRVSSSPLVAAYATSEQFYDRAKMLFWLSPGKDPLIVLKGILMLQWFNPDGPEHLSFDSSEFWLKIGVGIAHQIGLHRVDAAPNRRALRRRLWWSLVARDCLISASHGRPRAINLEDCQVPPPERGDFPDNGPEADIFVPYVEICCLLGDITDCCSRHHLPSSKRLQVESMLFRWLRTLSPTLRLTPTVPASDYVASDDNYDARLLHIHYFTTVSMLSRYTTPKEYVPHEAVFAASFAAGVFETLLARDEIKFLAPPFTIFCLICSMVLVSLRPFDHLWQAAQPDLCIFRECLLQLSKRWRSAIGASKALQNALDKNKHARTSEPFKSWQWDQRTACQYFEGCATELCRMWQVVQSEAAEEGLVLGAGKEDPVLRGPLGLSGAGVDPLISSGLDSTVVSGPEDDVMAFFQYDHINHWVFDDGNFTDF